MINAKEIKINKSPMLFYLSGEIEWFLQAGHQMTVRGYQFAVTNAGDMYIRVSEAETGALFCKVPMNLMILEETASKQGTLKFYENVLGPIVRDKLKESTGFRKMINKQKRLIETRLGKKPDNMTFSSMEDLKMYLEGMKGN